MTSRSQSSYRMSLAFGLALLGLFPAGLLWNWIENGLSSSSLSNRIDAGSDQGYVLGPGIVLRTANPSLHIGFQCDPEGSPALDVMPASVNQYRIASSPVCGLSLWPLSRQQSRLRPSQVDDVTICYSTSFKVESRPMVKIRSLLLQVMRGKTLL